MLIIDGPAVPPLTQESAYRIRLLPEKSVEIRGSHPAGIQLGFIDIRVLLNVLQQRPAPRAGAQMIFPDIRNNSGYTQQRFRTVALDDLIAHKHPFKVEVT